MNIDVDLSEPGTAVCTELPNSMITLEKNPGVAGCQRKSNSGYWIHPSAQSGDIGVKIIYIVSLIVTRQISIRLPQLQTNRHAN